MVNIMFGHFSTTYVMSVSPLNHRKYKRQQQANTYYVIPSAVNIGIHVSRKSFIIFVNWVIKCIVNTFFIYTSRERTKELNSSEETSGNHFKIYGL